MKKIILLFLFYITSYGQAVFDEGIQNPASSTLTPISHIVSQDVTGLHGKVLPENIPLNIVPPPVNYAPSTPDLGGHLKAIDTRLGQIGNTTAGVTNRIYFTGDDTTVTAGTFFTSNATGKGSTAAASPTPLSNSDGQKQYFDKDIIGNAFPSLTTFPPGVYAGQFSVRIDADNGQQRYGVEVYKTDNGGAPISSGIVGSPVGALGVTVIAILDSGLIDIISGNLTNISISGNLTSTLTLNTGERVRYHVFAEKVGIEGGNILMEIFYGSNHNSYYDVPVTFDTNSVLNKSGVIGVTTTDALNNLNAKIPADYSKIVYVNNVNPNSATIFDLNTPPTVNDNALKSDVNNLYIGTDASTWVYNGSVYVTKSVTYNISNFNYAGTEADSGGNKTAAIERTGTTGGAQGTASNHYVTKAQLDLKANDTAVLHTALNEPFTGIKSSTNSGSTGINGITLYNVGTTGSFSLFLQNSSTGNSMVGSNSSTGALNVFNSTTPSTGDLMQFTKSNALIAKVAHDGNITAPKFIKAGGVSSEFLKADGSVDASAYALDSDVLHDFGNEGFSGIKSSTNAGSSSINGFLGTNNGTTATYSFNAVTTAGGWGYRGQNTGSSGASYYSEVTSTGGGFESNVTTAGSGFTYIGKNNGANTFTVNKLGDVISNSYVKTGATSTDSLLAGGETLANPVSGTGTSGYFSKFTGTRTIGNSLLFENGINLGVNTVTPNFSSANRTVLDINGTSQSMVALSVGGVGKAFYFYTGTNAVLSNETAGSVMINTNGTSRVDISSTGTVGISNLSGTGLRTVLADAGGTLSAPVSDMALKTSIESITYGLKDILKMNPISFRFKEEYSNYGTNRQLGTIAQEMALIIPEATFTDPNTCKMGVEYSQLNAVYIKAIQELSTKIDALEARIKVLENK